MLHASEHAALLQRIAQTHPDPSLQQRARLLLLYDEGHETNAVAASVGLAPSTTSRWRRRYLDEGLAAVFPATALDAAGLDRPSEPERTPAPESSDAPQARVAALLDEVRKTIGGKKKLKAYRKHPPKKALKKLGTFLQARRERLRKRLAADNLSGKKRKKLKKQRKAIKRYLRRTRTLLDELS